MLREVLTGHHKNGGVLATRKTYNRRSLMFQSKNKLVALFLLFVIFSLTLIASADAGRPSYRTSQERWRSRQSRAE